MTVFGKTAALSEIATLAARAGAGGVASMAAAPWPLNMTAPVASAAGGYDIPSGMNPITQLHAREMVLPAKHADVIRGLSEGGAGGTGPVEVHIHQNIKAWDSVDARRVMMDNQPALVEALKNAHRNGFK